MKRLYNLDYLRGLAAFSIMIYHYLAWEIGHFTADTFIARIGIYGVSIFYILSGLTLYYVYHQRMTPTSGQIWSFAKKRFYRIFPLLWLVTIMTLVISRYMPDIGRLILNLTGLFGFVDWANYIATGVWSIGNELVFYTFFPLFIWMTRVSKIGMIFLSLTIFIVFVLFAFKFIDRSVPFEDQWHHYVNPLNQILFFLSGFLIGHIFQSINIKNSIAFGSMIVGLLLFTFYPVGIDTINLVTGYNRLIFALACCAICFGFYKTDIKVPGFAHKPLTFLGEASYSIYLIHPLVYRVFSFVDTKIYSIPDAILIGTSVVTSLIVSYIVYEYFEKYFMRIGKKKTGEHTKQPVPM